jgi:molybdate transport system substrate-binding protein
VSAVLRGISSMATRQVLADLAAPYRQHSGESVQIESVGGVDAARRVRAGEPFDLVILAADAIEQLMAAGAAVAGSRVDLVRSPVAVAVRTAPTIGYSTGPSGTALLRLFERWGIAAEVKDRLVQAPPGVPVGTLVARGEVALGFQQLSELIHLEGIAIAGALPTPVQIITTFSGAACAASTQRDAVDRLLAFMASPEAAAAKRRHGMEPA